MLRVLRPWDRRRHNDLVLVLVLVLHMFVVGVVVVVVVGGGGGIVDGAGLTIRWQGLWILLEPPLLT